MGPDPAPETHALGETGIPTDHAYRAARLIAARYCNQPATAQELLEMLGLLEPLRHGGGSRPRR